MAQAKVGGSLNPFETYYNEAAISEGLGSTTTDLSSPSLPLSKLTETLDLSPEQLSTQKYEETLPESRFRRENGMSTTVSASPRADHGFALPPIRPKTPNNSSQPKHTRRHSSLRNEYCPISPSPSNNLPAGTVQDLSASGTWSSSPSQYRQGRFPIMTGVVTSPETVGSELFEAPALMTQHQGVNLLPSPSFTQGIGIGDSHLEQHNSPMAASQSLNGHIHNSQYPYTESSRHQNYSPVLHTPSTSHLLAQARDRSNSTPILPQQFDYSPVISALVPSKMAPIKQHSRGLSSPSLHSLTKKSAAGVHRLKKRDLLHYQSTVTPRRYEYNDEAKRFINDLVASMRDMSKTEDNPGMLDTWRKIMKVKRVKIEKVSANIYEHIVTAHDQNGEPLGEKRPVFMYNDFAERFEAICETLKTQKTVCKHLLEDPYVYQVVDDPVNALKRVQNNRRVNQQKKEAIELGRKTIGVRGRGKGVRLEQTTTFDEQSEAEDDEDVSVKEESSGTESEYTTPTKRVRTRRAATKRRYKPASEEAEDEEESAEVASPPKRAKRNIHQRQISSASTISAGSLESPSSNQVPLYGSGEDAFGSSSASRGSNGSYFDSTYSTPRNTSLTTANGSPYQYSGMADHNFGEMRPMSLSYHSSPAFPSSFDHQGRQRPYSAGSLSEIGPLDNGHDVGQYQSYDAQAA